MEYDQRFTPGGISDAGYKVAFGVIPGICFGYLATILIFVWRTVELQERSEQLWFTWFVRQVGWRSYGWRAWQTPIEYDTAVGFPRTTLVVLTDWGVLSGRCPIHIHYSERTYTDVGGCVYWNPGKFETAFRDINNNHDILILLSVTTNRVPYESARHG